MLALLAVDANTTAALPITWWTLIGLAIPVFTAVAIRYRPSEKAPYAIAAILASAIAATLQGVLDDIPQRTFPAALALFLGQFVPAVFTYIGFWQPVVKVNERVAPNVGV